MTMTTTVELTGVEIKGPFSRKDGSEFYTHLLQTDSNKFQIYRNSDDQIESVGETVRIAYDVKSNTVNGKTYKNNIAKKVESVIGEETEKAPWTEASGKKPAKTPSKAPTTTSLGDSPTSKDISMEVSGLLQAIISKDGLSATTEETLRTALNLKRKIAAELLQTGSV